MQSQDHTAHKPQERAPRISYERYPAARYLAYRAS
jgi:hypothetical protein